MAPTAPVQLADRRLYNYGLLQVGALPEVPGTEYYTGLSSKTDVLRVLWESTLGWLRTSSVMLPELLKSSLTPAGDFWLPTFDARSVAQSKLAGAGDGEVSISANWLQAIATETTWATHARIIASLDPAAVAWISTLPGSGAPTEISTGKYPASLSFPPELLPTFRALARSLLIAVPPSHHHLRSTRDVISQLCIDSVVPDPSSVSIGPAELTLIAGALSYAGLRYPGRFEVIGNIDCGLKGGPVAPEFLSSTSTTSAIKLRTQDDEGLFELAHVFHGSIANTSTGVALSWMTPSGLLSSPLSGPSFPYDSSSLTIESSRPGSYGVRVRGIRVGVRTTPRVVLHTFGQCFMRRLFQWAYPKDGDPNTVRVRESVEFQRSDRTAYAHGVAGADVQRDEWESAFGPALQAHYGPDSNTSPLMRPGLPADHSLFRLLDFALASVQSGVPEASNETTSTEVSIFTAIRAWFGYSERASTDPAIDGSEYDDVISAVKDGYVGVKFSSLLDPFTALSVDRAGANSLRSWFSLPMARPLGSSRMTLEGDLYETFATARACFWDKVWIAHVINGIGVAVSGGLDRCFLEGIRTGSGAMNASLQTTPIRAGGLNPVSYAVKSPTFIEFSFRSMAAAFSITFSPVRRVGTSIVGPITKARRPDGCQVATIVPASKTSPASIYTAILTRAGDVANEASLSVVGAVEAVDVTLRRDRGVSLLQWSSGGAVVRDLPPNLDYFKGNGTVNPVAGGLIKGVSSTELRQAGFVKTHMLPSEGGDVVFLLDKSYKFNVAMFKSGSWLTLGSPSLTYGNLSWVACDMFTSETTVDQVKLDVASSPGTERPVFAAFRVTALQFHDYRQDLILIEAPPIFKLDQNAGTIVSDPSKGFDTFWTLTGDKSGDHVAQETLLKAGLLLPNIRSLRISLGHGRPYVDANNALKGMAAPFVVAYDSVLEKRTHVIYGAYLAGTGLVGEMREHDLDGVSLVDIQMGLHSFLVMTRRESQVESEPQNSVYECFLTPSIRDGGIQDSPWRYSNASARPKNVRQLLDDDEAAFMKIASEGVLERSNSKYTDHRRLWNYAAPEAWLWMEHSLPASGAGGAHGMIAALPTSTWPPAAGDSVTFIHGVVRDECLQVGVSTEGGWRGDLALQSGKGLDPGAAMSEEDDPEVEKELKNGRWAAKSSEPMAWDTPGGSL